MKTKRTVAGGGGAGGEDWRQQEMGRWEVGQNLKKGGSRQYRERSSK